MATSGLEHTGLPQAALRLSAGQVYNSTLTFFLLFRPEILNFSGIGRKVRVELLPTKIVKRNSLQLDPDFWAKKSQGRVVDCLFTNKVTVYNSTLTSGSTFWKRNLLFLGQGICYFLGFGQGQGVASTNVLSDGKTHFGLQISKKSNPGEEHETSPLRITPSVSRHSPCISSHASRK